MICTETDVNFLNIFAILEETLFTRFLCAIVGKNKKPVINIWLNRRKYERQIEKKDYVGLFVPGIDVRDADDKY